MTTNNIITGVNRRQFLAGCAAFAGTALAPTVFASVNPKPERQLAFRHLHTGEKIKLTYWAEGDYLADSLQEINHLLRDHRTGDVAQMDRALMDLLYSLQNRLDRQGEFQIISGYRSPKTNKMLRSQSSGVAKKSLHMQGRAIDIRLSGTELKHLRRAAIDLKLGGVGYYPKSNFIHVDTGRVRNW
ncbi:MAG: DUF882 domain-containing protein [Gammaproteobacteria bacterium]|nr:DUF882 domain-containing protein [Gammaproteobacteria bacterium]